jgi:hypothetical protein
MRPRTTPRFWAYYRNWPDEVRELADKNFRLLQREPRHPSLQFKKVGNVWSARVELAHRALVEDGEDFLWVWIGSHDDYDRLLRGRYPGAAADGRDRGRCARHRPNPPAVAFPPARR